MPGVVETYFNAPLKLEEIVNMLVLQNSNDANRHEKIPLSTKMFPRIMAPSVGPFYVRHESPDKLKYAVSPYLQRDLVAPVSERDYAVGRSAALRYFFFHGVKSSVATKAISKGRLARFLKGGVRADGTEAHFSVFLLIEMNALCRKMQYEHASNSRSPSP